MDLITYVRALLRKIDEQVASIDEALVSGMLADHTAYRSTCSRRDGLLQARSMATELLGPNKDDVRISV